MGETGASLILLETSSDSRSCAERRDQKAVFGEIYDLPTM